MKTATKTKKHLERYQLEKEERKAWQRAYYQRNKEAYREKFRKYFRENKAKYAAQTAARRAKKKQACPSWTDKTQLSRFYGSCPVGFAVDSPRQRLCMRPPRSLEPSIPVGGRKQH